MLHGAFTPDNPAGQQFLAWWWLVPLASLVLLGPGMLALARRYPWVAPASARVGLATGATVLSLLAADNAYWVAKRWAARRPPDEIGRAHV